jgi:RNA polymerase sigma-70 factor (sigma-E family)
VPSGLAHATREALARLDLKGEFGSSGGMRVGTGGSGWWASQRGGPGTGAGTFSVATTRPARVIERVEVSMENGFEAFVAQAWPGLLRSAWLLTGDWHRAEDLVQTVLTRAYGRLRIQDGAAEAQLRSMLATTSLSWWRGRWRGEIPFDEPPDQVCPDEYANVEMRHTLAQALQRLPARQRAVLMLRFHRDLTEAATAQALGMSIGTVKSYTSRALSKLRADERLRDLLTEEARR